jgi:hypothetical protein
MPTTETSTATPTKVTQTLESVQATPDSPDSHATPTTLRRAAQIFFAKKTVSRKQPPVLRDLAEYQASDFVYDTTSLDRVQRLIDEVPADSRGMRWVHDGEAVLFYVEHDLDAPYDEFVSRVDISHVGFTFRDVLGITTEVVRRDDEGRSTLQLERIAALAQPNYTAFMGKDELDVYKLERIDYGPDEQRNWMRTVHSPNASAVCDDGYLAFVRGPSGGTTIKFLACQQFPVPPLMKLLRMDRWKWLRRQLTESAYRRFYGTTMKNLMASYHGIDFRVGKASRP